MRKQIATRLLKKVRPSDDNKLDSSAIETTIHNFVQSQTIKQLIELQEQTRPNESSSDFDLDSSDETLSVGNKRKKTYISNQFANLLEVKIRKTQQE